MTLSFTTRWGKQMGELAGQPNHFVEKIMFSLYKENPRSIVELDKLYRKTPNTECDSLLEIVSLRKHGLSPKIHTIREDTPDRWKPGNKIHFVINNRTKNRFQFAPVVEVKSVQKIEIEYHGGNAHVYISNDDADTIKQLNRREINELALNDGFNSVIEFFKWFNTDFSGKIIHWTNKTY